MSTLFGKDNWETRLQEYLEGNQDTLTPSVGSTIRKYAPIALAMDKFYEKLQKESKSTPYPALDLERLIGFNTQEI